MKIQGQLLRINKLFVKQFQSKEHQAIIKDVHLVCQKVCK